MSALAHVEAAFATARADPIRAKPSALEQRLAAVRAQYLLTLPDRIAELLAAAAAASARPTDPNLLGAARRLAHRLHGTAGSYGEMEVSEVARWTGQALDTLATNLPATTNAWLEAFDAAFLAALPRGG